MVSSELKLRPFESQDQEAVCRLILNGLGEHFGFIDESLNPDLNNIKETYIEPGHIFIVACLGNNIVGTGALIAEEQNIARMVRVSTHQDYRRQGIGKTIASYLIQVARDRSYQRILVATNNDWQAAIALYKQLGFVEFKRTKVGISLVLTLVDTVGEPLD